MKGAVHQEKMSILNTYAPFKKLIALRALIDTNTMIVGDLNTPLSPIDKPSRPKISKGTSELLHTLEQIDMIDIYKVDINK
jgi:hypothetical protein